jgi:hypothetical protein
MPAILRSGTSSIIHPFPGGLLLDYSSPLSIIEIESDSIFSSG